MMSNIFAAAQESPKPVSTTSGSQQRELNACSSEQGLSPLQEVLPTTYTEKLSENEGKRKSPPRGHKENLVFQVNMFKFTKLIQIQKNIYSNATYNLITCSPELIEKKLF